jgi:methylglyoxal synthase
MALGFKIPKKSVALTIQSDHLEEVIHHVHLLASAGYELYATAETHPFLVAKGIQVKLVHYGDSSQQPNIVTMISNKEIDMVVNLWSYGGGEKKNNYLSRRTAVDFGVPLLTNPQLFKLFAEALKKNKEGKLQFTQVSQSYPHVT